MRLRNDVSALLTILALGTPGIATRAWAAWPHDPNNGNLPLCTAAGGQASPQLVTDGAGAAIVTWYDYRSGVPHIYAQRVNAAGVPQWTADGVPLCTAPIGQTSPMIISDGAGGAIVTWVDSRGGTTTDIYAQRVSPTGAPKWTTDGIALCTAANYQLSPTIASDGAGGAIVTWYDLRSGDYHIYAQRVSVSGVPQWTPDGVALCTAVGGQTYPTIATDGAGGAIVTWSDNRSGPNTDIYAQRVNAAGAPQWTPNGVVVCLEANIQEHPAIVSDGGGGAIITWEDDRSGISSDIYAQRVNAAGAVLWYPAGVALCTEADNQRAPQLDSDGAGGAIVVWTDDRIGLDIHAQRVNAQGRPQWTLDGVALSTATGGQSGPTIAADGAGGAIVTWTDARNSPGGPPIGDVYAQRVSAAGAVQWQWDGVAVCTALGDQQVPSVISDGAGGAIVVWQDPRGPTTDIYAQRIERFGKLGSPEPTIASVRDVPNDQGGKVKVSWFASYLDADPGYEITNYTIWRSAPPNVALAALRAGARMVHPDEPLPPGGGRVFTRSVEDTQVIFWELVGSQVADGDAGYSLVTATTSDSLAAGNPRTLFRVQARDVNDYAFWNSAPDSGYSVDNLPPGAPSPFAAGYAAGATHLHWGENHEPDLAGYRLYRGSSAGFVPGPSNLVVAQADTGYADPGAAGSYYKLSAVDVHGNESPFALVTPGGTTAVGDVPPRQLALALGSADPGRGGASLRYSVPQAADVRLEVYDLAGRTVRLLARGREDAGDYGVRWDGRNDTGQPVSGGMYIVRLEAAGHALVKRLVELP